MSNAMRPARPSSAAHGTHPRSLAPACTLAELDRAASTRGQATHTSPFAKEP